MPTSTPVDKVELKNTLYLMQRQYAALLKNTDANRVVLDELSAKIGKINTMLYQHVRRG